MTINTISVTASAAITMFFTDFIKAQAGEKSKVKISTLVDALNSDEVQKQLSDVLRKATPKTKREKATKLKDPLAPKGVRTAYIFFSQDFRASHPDLKGKAVMSGAGAAWNSADEKTKASFQKKALKDKARFDKEMSKYERPSDDALAALPENQRKRRGGGPKKPKSARTFFCENKDNRTRIKAKNPKLDTKGVVKLLAEEWKNLADEDKTTYQDLATTDKERAAEERSVFKKTQGESAEELAPQKKGRGRPKSSKTAPTSPKNKPVVKSKSKSEESDDSDDESVPKNKPTPVSPKSKPAVKSKTTPAPVSPKSKPVPNKSEESDDSDDESAPKSKPAVKGKTTPAKGKPIIKSARVLPKTILKSELEELISTLSDDD